MNKKNIVLVVLLLTASIFYFILPYNIENFDTEEEFKNHGRRRRKRHWYNYLPWADGYKNRWHYYNPYYNPWSVSSYYPTWLYTHQPHVFGKYNWFDYSNCPSGCAADSTSPSGFRCTPNNSALSCVSDTDCTGCTVPFVPVVY